MGYAMRDCNYDAGMVVYLTLVFCCTPSGGFIILVLSNIQILPHHTGPRKMDVLIMGFLLIVIAHRFFFYFPTCTCSVMWMVCQARNLRFSMAMRENYRSPLWSEDCIGIASR